MKIKRIISILLFVCLLVTTPNVTASAANETSMFYIDSINGTRWQDYLCVYMDRDNTGQNQWGQNIIVNSNGIVTEKIPAGDARGKNLTIPKGGMVVSGTGDVAKQMYDSAKIGGKCLFDEYSMRVYFSEGEINPFYTESITITGYNKVRYEDTVIIYNKSGQTTGTNVWGYEVCVDANGYVISAGGNNNVIPTNGYVISVINSADQNFLKMYFTVGAKCEIKNSSVTVTYGKEQLGKTVESELALVKESLQTAKSQYKLLDYKAIENKLKNIKTTNITTLEERNSIIKQVQELYPMLVEPRTVETRSVWYEPTERSASAVKSTVAAMKKAGINELVLCVNSSNGTLVPVDTNKLPFKKDSITQSVDILQTYIKECRANGISIVFWVPVFSSSSVNAKTEWLDVTNTGVIGRENFLSPANSEFRQVFMDYIRFILNKYDIDGLQLDYIRYAQFYNGVDSGYDAASIKLFKEKTGNDESVVKAIGQQLNKHPKWQTWCNYKTELVNSWVSEIYSIVNSLNPEIYLSAAVAASNSVGNYCQDPSAWVKGGYIDGIYVMSYSEEINETTTKPFLNARGDSSYLVMGCGAYLSISNQSIIEQTDNSSVLGADGTAYFEWGAVRDHGYTEIFKNSLFKNDAIPITGDVNTVVNRLVATAKERILLYCESASAAKAKELKGILSSLPDKGVSKSTLNTIISKLNSSLDNSVEKYLTADLSDAVRVLNMAKSTNTNSNGNTNQNPSGGNNASGNNNAAGNGNAESNSENTVTGTEDSEGTEVIETTEGMESTETMDGTEILEETTEADTNIGSNSDEPSEQQNDGKEASNFPIAPVVIGSLLLLSVIAIVILKRKNLIIF